MKKKMNGWWINERMDGWNGRKRGTSLDSLLFFMSFFFHSIPFIHSSIPQYFKIIHKNKTKIIIKFRKINRFPIIPIIIMSHSSSIHSPKPSVQGFSVSSIDDCHCPEPRQMMMMSPVQSHHHHPHHLQPWFLDVCVCVSQTSSSSLLLFFLPFLIDGMVWWVGETRHTTFKPSEDP